MKTHPYRKFAGMLTVSFIVMYAVMFLNVDQANHVYLSLTRFYMTLLMIAPMAVIMLVFMPKMYPNRKSNGFIFLGSVAVFVLSLAFLRSQAFIGDKQYMQAMIPHHSSAILTSKHATFKDTEVKQLSERIIESQEKEIEQMKQILKRIDR